MKKVSKFFFALVFISGMAISFASADILPKEGSVACVTKDIDWTQAQKFYIIVGDNFFSPGMMQFSSCQPYHLIIEHNGHMTHNFTSPDFLRSLLVRNPATGELFPFTEDALYIKGQTVTELDIIPTASMKFTFQCTDGDHAKLGQQGFGYVIL